MPNRMSEDMSDRMPEDLPVRKCINVMVGITRSKVIFFLSFFLSILSNVLIYLFRPSVHPSIHHSVRPSIQPSIHPSFHNLSQYIYTILTVIKDLFYASLVIMFFSVCLAIHLSLSLSLLMVKRLKFTRKTSAGTQTVYRNKSSVRVSPCWRCSL